jgi:hypothetical protein
VPTLPLRRYSRSFSTRYIRLHFTSVSPSRPSAPFSTTSFSCAGRLSFWLEPISTLTSGARATRSGWLTMIAGCGPTSAKLQVQITYCLEVLRGEDSLVSLFVRRERQTVLPGPTLRPVSFILHLVQPPAPFFTAPIAQTGIRQATDNRPESLPANAANPHQWGP